ncbi:hypothetical protein C0431_06220 [bacterium]|nr:hypothetical protein [bacterium]
MQDFIATRALSRSRFTDSIKSLSQGQLNFRLHENTLTIGEMAIHVAGVEISFASQLFDAELTSLEDRIKSAATDGAVNELPFPFTEDEITPSFVNQALEIADQWIEKLYAQGESLRTKELKSALGPIIPGEGAFVRLGFHPGYHHGQVYMITTAPNFPRH